MHAIGGLIFTSTRLPPPPVAWYPKSSKRWGSGGGDLSGGRQVG